MIEYDFAGIFKRVDYVGDIMQYIKGDFSTSKKIFIDNRVPIDLCRDDLNLLNSLKTMEFKRHDIRIEKQIENIGTILKNFTLHNFYTIKSKRIGKVRLLFTGTGVKYFTKVSHHDIDQQIANISKQINCNQVEIQKRVIENKVKFMSYVNHRYVIDFISCSNYRGFENIDGNPIDDNNISAISLKSGCCIIFGKSKSHLFLNLITVYDLETHQHLLIGYDMYGFIASFNIERKYCDDTCMEMLNVSDDFPKLLDVAIDLFKKFSYYDN